MKTQKNGLLRIEPGPVSRRPAVGGGPGRTARRRRAGELGTFEFAKAADFGRA
jgi:hypothetical protein